MSGRPSIHNDALVCPHHKEEIKLIDLAPGSYPDATYRLFCKSCKPEPKNKNRNVLDLQKVRNHTYPQHGLYVVSLGEDSTPSSLPQESAQNTTPKGSDFQTCETDHIIFDSKSTGFAPRAMVYAQDLKYLITGDQNGKVIVWDMSATPKPIFSATEEDCIRCICYVKISPTQRFCLFGVKDSILVHQLSDKGTLQYHKELRGHSSINHIHYNEATKRIFSCGYDEIIRIWNVEKWELETEINIKEEKIPEPLATLIYLEQHDTLAIERAGGLSFLHLEKKPYKIEHLNIPNRRGYGFVYLKQLDKYLVRSHNTCAWLVDRKTISKIHEFNGKVLSEEYPGHEYIPNEDESLVLTNSNGASLLVYEMSEYEITKIDLKGYLDKSSGICFLPDQKLIIVGDESQGVILMLKVGGSSSESAPERPQIPRKVHKKENNHPFSSEEDEESKVPPISKNSKTIQKPAAAASSTQNTPKRKGRPPKNGSKKKEEESDGESGLSDVLDQGIASKHETAKKGMEEEGTANKPRRGRPKMSEEEKEARAAQRQKEFEEREAKKQAVKEVKESRGKDKSMKEEEDEKSPGSETATGARTRPTRTARNKKKHVYDDESDFLHDSDFSDSPSKGKKEPKTTEATGEKPKSKRGRKPKSERDQAKEEERDEEKDIKEEETKEGEGERAPRRRGRPPKSASAVKAEEKHEDEVVKEEIDEVESPKDESESEAFSPIGGESKRGRGKPARRGRGRPKKVESGRRQEKSPEEEEEEDFEAKQEEEDAPRRRGRPPKADKMESEAETKKAIDFADSVLFGGSEQEEGGSDKELFVEDKRKTRPRRKPTNEEKQPSSENVDQGQEKKEEKQEESKGETEGVNPTPKRRGRPPKSASEGKPKPKPEEVIDVLSDEGEDEFIDYDSGDDYKPEKRQQKKAKSTETAGEVEGEEDKPKRGRGRPKKSESTKKETDEDVAGDEVKEQGEGEAEKPTPKRRGRPPKEKKVQEEGENGAEGDPAAAGGESNE